MYKKYTLVAVLFLLLLFLPLQTGKAVFAETAFAQEITYPCPDADTVLQKGDRGDTVC